MRKRSVSAVLEKAGRNLIRFLEQEDLVREKALKNCREITRLASSAIQELHQGQLGAAEQKTSQALSLLKKTRKVLVGYPEISFAGFLHNAEKELVEAVVLLRYLSAREIPAPEEFGFDPISYLHGLAESTGELRRYLLDALRRQPDFDGEECLKVMDAIYFFLTNFTFPDALTRSLRRQVDYVRGILEKTRADVTLAVLRSERRKNG